MQRLKNGKEEIIYLLTNVIERYKQQTGQQIIQNTNRKNYEVIAIALSEISNQLPQLWENYGTEVYPPEENVKKQAYPYRKYDITGGQIKDALNGIVANPRPFLVDACYIYLYGVGRKAFEQNPADDNLLDKMDDKSKKNLAIEDQNQALEQEYIQLKKENLKQKKRLSTFAAIALALLIGLISFFVYYSIQKANWSVTKKDFNILPYQPTQAEIDSLEGIWLCYTGSPQARISDPERYHKVVTNIVDIKFKNGYFTYNRYGASFDHIGYMQFQSPGIVSIYSRIKSTNSTTASPRHSLLNLNTNKSYLSAISASWNFDTGEKNTIIGIREIYMKQGKGGTIEEVINEIENASCKCKIIRWHQDNKPTKTYNLKNELLDTLSLQHIQPLLNESSILLGIPQPGLVITKDSIR